jgi:NAD(P)-dependent dehydrogenase (short-subunit alcohol dehydrogenase family)
MILEKFNLKGKKGIVTGGGSGIGQGIAAGLVQAGAELIITGRNKDKLETSAKKISRFGRPVIPYCADMADMDAIIDLVDHAMETFGRIDFLFNNAGIIRRNSCEDYLEEDWDEVMSINLKGPFFFPRQWPKP